MADRTQILEMVNYMMQRNGRIRRVARLEWHVMPDDKKAHKASATALAHIDELLDEALKQTFPASDPVAINVERTTDAMEQDVI